MAPSNHNSETEIENNNINKKKKIKVAESSKNVTKAKKEKEKKKELKIKEENKDKKNKEEVKNKDPKIKEAKKKKKEQKNKEQQQQKKKDPKNKEEKKKKKQKSNTKEKEKKKLNLFNGNGNLKQHHDDKPLIAPCSASKVQKRDLKQEKGKEEDNAIVINGRISGTKPKKPKRKREEHGEEEDEEEEAKTHAFPINRIRTVIKGEDPDSRVSHEAIIAINKATEKFLEQFTQDAYTRCVQDRKKSLSYMHLAYVVSKERRYDFLSDFVPGKVKAEDALRERNSGGNGGG